MPKILIRTALSLVLCLVSMPDPGVGVTVPFDPAPTFALSACWSPGGNVLVPAIQEGVVFIVDPAAGTVDRLARPGQGAKELNRPSRIACNDESGHLVVSDDAFHLVWFDSSLEPTGGIFLPGNPGTPAPNVPVRDNLGYLGVYDLVWHDGAVHVAGTFRLDGELYKGVGRLSRRPLGLDLLHDHYHENPSYGDFSGYLYFSLRALASTPESLYYLYFDGEPVLFEVTSGERVDLPEPLRVMLPSLRALSHRPMSEKTALLFARVRQFRIPVGIWGWRGSLYLLSWRPGEEGLTWELWRRAEDGGWRGPWEVPVDAPDLVVAPGPEAWAFVIKGPRTEPGRQEVSAVETVPAETIAEALR